MNILGVIPALDKLRRGDVVHDVDGISHNYLKEWIMDN
jgi:hypothetical protein